MPVTGAATDGHRLVRQLRVVRGTMHFVLELQPGSTTRAHAHLELTTDGAVFRAEGIELTVHSGGELPCTCPAAGEPLKSRA